MNRLIAALGAAAMLLPSAAVMANPLADEQALVKTSDLDLASADGQTRLGKRIARAADEVCGQNMDRIHLLVAAKARACRIAVIDDLEARNRAERPTDAVNG